MAKWLVFDPKEVNLLIFDLDELPREFKSLRVSRGLDQRTIVERTGHSKSFVSQVEGGLVTSSMDNLVRLFEGVGFKLKFCIEVDENDLTRKIQYDGRNLERKAKKKNPKSVRGTDSTTEAQVQETDLHTEILPDGNDSIEEE